MMEVYQSLSLFMCRNCGAELGRTDGVRLLIACTIGEQSVAIEFRDRTRPYCPLCHRLTVWYPAKEGKVTAPVPVVEIVLANCAVMV
jgi:hypothetical protein